MAESEAFRQMINSAFGVVAGLRKLGFTNSDITEAVERARWGDEAIEASVMSAALDRYQLAMVEDRCL